MKHRCGPRSLAPLSRGVVSCTATTLTEIVNNKPPTSTGRESGRRRLLISGSVSAPGRESRVTGIFEAQSLLATCQNAYQVRQCTECGIFDEARRAPFAGRARTGATGLEPATSGVTDRRSCGLRDSSRRPTRDRGSAYNGTIPYAIAGFVSAPLSKTANVPCPELCPRIGESNLTIASLRRPIYRDYPTA